MSAILLIEDDLTFSTMIKAWLSRKGFEIETASNIARGLTLIKQSQFDLILSDMRLPDGEGLNILDYLTSNNISTPLRIMTSYADVQNAVNAMKHGAFEFIKYISTNSSSITLNASIKNFGLNPITKSVPSFTALTSSFILPAFELTFNSILSPLTLIINGFCQYPYLMFGIDVSSFGVYFKLSWHSSWRPPLWVSSVIMESV